MKIILDIKKKSLILLEVRMTTFANVFLIKIRKAFIFVLLKFFKIFTLLYYVIDCNFICLLKNVYITLKKVVFIICLLNYTYFVFLCIINNQVCIIDFFQKWKFFLSIKYLSNYYFLYSVL